jgi:hypothetical protein
MTSEIYMYGGFKGGAAPLLASISIRGHVSGAKYIYHSGFPVKIIMAQEHINLRLQHIDILVAQEFVGQRACSKKKLKKEPLLLQQSHYKLV